jgi:hypothetical protein
MCSIRSFTRIADSSRGTQLCVDAQGRSTHIASGRSAELNYWLAYLAGFFLSAFGFFLVFLSFFWLLLPLPMIVLP